MIRSQTQRIQETGALLPNLRDCINQLQAEEYQDCTERHLQVLDRVLRDFEKGLYISQLEDINIILDILIQKPEAEYQQRLNSFVILFSKPLLPSRANEERLLCEHIKKSFEIISTLSYSEDRDLQYNSVEALITKVEPSEKHSEFFLQLIQDSALISNVAQTMKLLINQYTSSLSSTKPGAVHTRSLTGVTGTLPAPLVHVLTLYNYLSTHRGCCENLIANCASQQVCTLIEMTSCPCEEAVYISIECLWNFLDNSYFNVTNGPTRTTLSELFYYYRTTNAMYHLQDPHYYKVLAEVFHWHVKNSFKDTQKEYRNTLMLILVLLASRKHWIGNFSQCSILSDLLDCVGSPQKIRETKGDTKLTDLDKDFILTIWACLANITKNHEPSQSIIGQSDFLGVLLHYVDMESNPGDNRLWSMEQRHILCEYSLSILCVILPFYAKEFQQWDGMKVIERSLKSFLTHRAQYQRHLHGILDLSSKVATSDGFEDGFNMQEMIPFYNDLLTDSSIPPSLKEDICRTICHVCRRKDNHDVFVSNKGVEILLNLLSTGTLEKAVDLKLGILVIGAIWTVVPGFPDCEETFIFKEGTILLMDALERAPSLLRYELLGLLADIIQNTRIVGALGFWRSAKTSQNAYQFLLDIWEKETQRLEIRESREGCILSLHHPLYPPQPLAKSNPIYSPGKTTEKLSKLSQAMTMSKVYEGNDCYHQWQVAVQQTDLRVPLIMIFNQLHIDNPTEFSDLYGLHRTQYLHLLLILSGKEFLRAEQWHEVRKILQYRGLHPILQDSLLIERHLEESYNLARKLKSEQYSLYYQDKIRESKDVELYYKQLTSQEDEAVKLLLMKEKQRVAMRNLL